MNKHLKDELEVPRNLIKKSGKNPFQGLEERGENTPLFQDALLQNQQLQPNPDLKQPSHFCHAFQTTCQVSQPILKMKAMVPSLLAH